MEFLALCKNLQTISMYLCMLHTVHEYIYNKLYNVTQCCTKRLQNIGASLKRNFARALLIDSLREKKKEKYSNQHQKG